MTTALVTLLAVVVALLVVLVTGLLRSHAQALRTLLDRGRDRPAPPGSMEGAGAGDVVGTTPAGGAVHVRIAGVPQPTLLLFLTSSCTTCRALWESLPGGAPRVLPADLRVVVVTKGAEADSSARLRRVAPAEVTVVMSTATWHTYGVATAPSFVLVDGASGRVVARGPAPTWDDIAAACEHRTGVR